jgi:hypothetical protein
MLPSPKHFAPFRPPLLNVFSCTPSLPDHPQNVNTCPLLPQRVFTSRERHSSFHASLLMLRLNTMISPLHLLMNTSTFSSCQLWYLILRTPSCTPPRTIWRFRWYTAPTSPLVSHSHVLHFISNMTSTFNLHDLLPSSFPVSMKGECLNFKGVGSVGCYWLLPWHFWFALCFHPSIIMW